MIIDEPNNNIFIIEKLNNLKNSLDQENLNLRNIKRQIEELSEYDNTKNYEYLKSLLEPINKKGVKIPSNKPIPTCTFQLHNFLTFRTSTKGNDVFCLNPLFLSNDSWRGKEYTVNGLTFNIANNANNGLYFFNNNNNYLDGKQRIAGWYFASTFSQTIPDVYAKYRVVSACLTVRYIGQLDEVSGVIGGGINYNKNNYLGTRVVGNFGGSGVEEWGTRNPVCADFGNFELIRDSFYFQENNCLEGLKMLYFPLDNSFQEFRKVFDCERFDFEMFPGEGPVIKIPDTYFQPGFNWYVYVLGAPVTTTHNFRLDWYINYECIPKAEFLNYIPMSIDIYNITKEMREKIIEEVRENAITIFK